MMSEQAKKGRLMSTTLFENCEIVKYLKGPIETLRLTISSVTVLSTNF